MKTRSRNRNEKNNICGIKYSESCAKQGNKYSCNDRDTQKCCSYPERISNRTFRKASVNRVPATINSTTKSTLKSQPNCQKPSANRVNLSTGLTRGNADIRCKTRTAHTKSIRTKKVGRKCPFEGKDKENEPVCASMRTLQNLRAIAAKEGISTGGQKAQLEERIHWHRKFNLNSTKVQPLRPVLPRDATEFTEAEEYKQCDKNLQQSLRWLSTVQIWSYFVSRSARHGYGKGKQLKQAAFLRNICYAQINNETFQVRGYCGATMRKSTMYLLRLEHNTEAITKTSCTCPAGQGNLAACKHIAALLMALEEFARTGHLQQNQTCTDVLQTWHRPPKHTDRSMMYRPLKDIFKDNHSDRLPQITDLPLNDLHKQMMNNSLNRGMHMTIHRSRYVMDMRNYFAEHSYAKNTISDATDPCAPGNSDNDAGWKNDT